MQLVSPEWHQRVPRVSGMSLGWQLGSPGCQGCPHVSVPAVGALPHNVPEDGPALLVEEREAAHHPRPRGRHCPRPHHPPGHRHHPHLEPLSPRRHGHARAQIQMGGKNQRDLCVCVCVVGGHGDMVRDTDGRGEMGMGGHGGGQASGMWGCVGALTWGCEGDTCGDTGMRGCVGGVGAVPGHRGRARHRGTKDTVVALPPSEAGWKGGEKGEGRGGDRDMGAPERLGHGGPGVAPYLQGLGDTDMCGAVGPLFWGTGQPQGTHIWGSWGHGGPGGCRDRGLSGGPGDMGGPKDPAGGEG